MASRMMEAVCEDRFGTSLAGRTTRRQATIDDAPCGRAALHARAAREPFDGGFEGAHNALSALRGMQARVGSEAGFGSSGGGEQRLLIERSCAALAQRRQRARSRSSMEKTVVPASSQPKLKIRALPGQGRARASRATGMPTSA